MDILPILSSLRRHRTAAALIVLEIALSCAIICNALFLVSQRVEALHRPSHRTTQQQVEQYRPAAQRMQVPSRQEFEAQRTGFTHPRQGQSGVGQQGSRGRSRVHSIRQADSAAGSTPFLRGK